MILKEFECIDHGYFTASHPICPHMGCESKYVERVFLTPVGITSDKTKYTDSSLQAIANDYKLSDMSNRNGNSIMQNMQNQRSPSDAIWGKEGVGNYDGMLAQASRPTVVVDAEGKQHVADHMGMRAAAKAFGIDQRPLPPATTTIAKGDSADRAKVTS